MNIRTLTSLTASALASIAFAQPHAGDILLSIENNQIQTGHINLDGTLVYNLRVFETTLGLFGPNFTDTPGFDCQLGTFPYPSSNGFNILAALHVWNGSDFNTISPVGMDIKFGPLTRTTPPTDTVVPGYTLQVAPNGEWHRHLGYFLLDPAPDGVYLLSLNIFSTNSTIQTSPPFWLVFNQNQPAAQSHHAARWAQVHLAGACAADVDDGSATGTPDGGVTIDDLLYYLSLFSAGDLAADVDDGSGTGTFDSGVTIDDLLYFLSRFAAGC